MPLSQFDERSLFMNMQTIADGFGTDPINVFGYEVRPMRLDSVICSSDDTVDNLIQFWASYNGSWGSLLGSVVVPAGAGFVAGTPNVDAIPLLFPEQRCFHGDAHYGLAIVAFPLVTATKSVHLTLIGGYV